MEVGVGGWWWVGGKPNLVISDELIKNKLGLRLGQTPKLYFRL